MIDFSTLHRRNKTYAGANGSKIAVMYEDVIRIRWAAVPVYTAAHRGIVGRFG